ncbi:sensor histidine kinase [Tenacibaculum sp. IB213877]|uniref:ATP-binding protein n=1 Tax=Tenacibaculum sp. IB213877 TaxID=3097351 RepID=UPI002A59A6CB|nr:sensor histidine kinase [Tenacibaculum sp. IB213877]MDY0780279.1 sensor histidine kinase [Tenacibaculum sp. IB213877]
MLLFRIIIKKIVPLIFVFLFSQTRAESNDLAFSYLNYDINKDSLGVHYKRYKIAKKLYDTQEYTKALKVLFDIKYEDENDYIFKAETNFLISEILFKTKNYEECIKYSLRSLKNLNKNTINEGDANLNMVLKSRVFLKLSASYIKEKKTDSALFFLDKITVLNSLNSEFVKIKGDAYGNIAAIYIRDNVNLDLAEDYLNKSIEIHSKYQNKMALAASYSNLATIYIREKDFSKAKTYYIKALNLLEEETDKEAIEYKELLYDNLAWSLYNLKDYTAYEYVTKSYYIRDSLNEDKLKAEIKKIELRHNIDIVKKAEENKRLTLERNNWIIGIVGVLVSLLFLYLANLYKLRQKDLSLKLSKNELEQQRKLDKLKSEAQSKIINAAIDGKESERKQIAEILHDNVSALLSSANMHLQATQKQYGEDVPIEIQKSQQIILEASQKIRDLSHTLVSSVLLKFGLEYAIKDAAKKFSNSHLKIYTAISNVNRYTQDYEIKIFNIVQELINNIIKHSKAQKAYIAMEEEDGLLIIMVKDDGEGFDIKKSKDGIGLNQIKARIDMLSGTFEVESDKNSGTKIIIKVPVIRKKITKSA